MKLRTIAIIQARRASSRLPDKVLLDIAGQPMLTRVYDRTCMASTVEQTVIATTTDPADDAIYSLCKQRGYPVFRGSAQDVLDRYYQTARFYNAQVVVRITADCPVIDPDVIDLTVNSFLGTENAPYATPATQTEFLYDFAANRLPPPWGRTYPIGLDTEVCSFKALETAWFEADVAHQREHVMPFFYEQPERFRILHVTHEPDYGHMRWTVDTPEDLELIRQIYSHFPDQDDFGWLEILDLIKRKPELATINASVVHKDYREVDDRNK